MFCTLSFWHINLDWVHYKHYQPLSKAISQGYLIMSVAVVEGQSHFSHSEKFPHWSEFNKPQWTLSLLSYQTAMW